MERELQVARQLQASLLPDGTPQIPGWEFVVRWQPAREVAGDYYDFILCEEGQLGLVIADVSGKGMPSALFMALTRSIVRASMGHAPSPADGIAHANRLICADAGDGMFVTLFFALLDPVTGGFTYVNAGHNPPLLCKPGDRAGGRAAAELMPTGMALGIITDWPFEQRTLHLEPGDFIVLYTDGVTDAMDPHRQPFGKERLEEIVWKQCGRSAIDILAALEHAIAEHTGSMAQFDDIAILVVRRL